MSQAHLGAFRARIWSILALAMVAAAPTAAIAQSTVVTIDDLRLEVGVSAPQVSADGQSVVVVTSRPNYEDNRFERTLVLVDAQTGETLDLTAHRPAVRQPRWSPSGDEIAFVDRSAEEESPQVFVLPMRGGEARQLTHAEAGVSSFHWTTDGDEILFTAADTSPELEGEERHNRSFEVENNSYLTLEAPTSVHLWRVPSRGGEETRITEGEWSIADMRPSPDGRSVALQVTPRPHTGELIRTTIRLLDLTSGEIRELVETAPSFIAGFSPDGSTLAYSRSLGDEPFFNPAGIFLQPVAGGDAREATTEVDRNIQGMDWLPEGEALVVGGPDLTRGALWLQPVDGSPTQLDLGGVHPASPPVVSDGGGVFFVGREADRPAELYSMQVGEWNPRRLTGFNDALAAKRFGRVETVEWDGPDGFRQNGVLRYPPDFQEGQRYPLVLSIHGGPMGASTEAFATFDHIMAARGWLVFSPNYRGSSTQGKAFQSAVVNDAGEGPGRDVMSGVEAVKALDIVDDERVAVSGWSYGGYMTAWLTAHYDGWTVAMAGAAVTDWFDWYTMADMNTWAGYGLDGSPWT
ncbi:MAG: S9 family peptidase, partial [Longimicrobiales bacterium]